MADFHALRYTFDTALQNSGALPRVSMELMRHSDPRLTLLRYTDASLLPTAAAVNALPSYLDAVPAEGSTEKPPAAGTVPSPSSTPAEPLDGGNGK